MSAPGKIMERIEALAKISGKPGEVTRVFATPAMRRANKLVAQWMREAGMEAHVDAIGNLIGHYAAERPGARTLLLGSHLDTVRNAGKFDGSLGVMLALACVEHLHFRKIRLPFAIAVVGFADEEGVRYQTAYLGSKALAGCFNEKDLQRKDANGISMADAIKHFGGNPAKLTSARLDPRQLIGYIEAHIEQGPVLEKNNLAVGIVSAIAGQTRARISFIGRAGHAGTTPMSLRKDALCAAAEVILAVETLAKKTEGLVATVGEIAAFPGVGNVIPGEVRLSLDVRHANDSIRKAAQRALKQTLLHIGRQRNLQLGYAVVQETATVNCSAYLSRLLGQSVKYRQQRLVSLPSGAGHDAAVMAAITPAAMLFIRCQNGVSHHPDESVKIQDAEIALDVLNNFLQLLAQTYRRRMVATGRSKH
ncbi:MAG TPA: allantoate amidohydrolase [Candidatus Sulfopaludibacter sp.]|nr:allantoate amidohydrolase [Candidatus Sulfopaludibacter sp.]